MYGFACAVLLSFFPTAQLRGTTGEKFCSSFLLLFIGCQEWRLQISLAELIARGVQFESHMHAICPRLCLPDLHNSSSIHQSMKGESIVQGNHLREHTRSAIAGFHSTAGPAHHPDATGNSKRTLIISYYCHLVKTLIVIATILTSHVVLPK